MSQTRAAARSVALTRRRFLAAAAGLVAGGGAASRPRSPRRRAEARRRSGSSPPGCRRASTPGRRRSPQDSTATRSRPASTGCCSSTSCATRPRTTCARSRLRCGRSSAPTPGARNGLLFTASWAPHYFEQVLGVSFARSRAPRSSRTSSCRRFDDYDLCLHLACDDEQRLAAVELALVHGHALAGRGTIDLARASRWRETRTGFVGTGLPAAHQHVNGIPPGNPVPAELTAVHGLQVRLHQEPGDRGRRHDPGRAVRQRHDDAGELHAPAARQLVPGSSDEDAARGAHVRARGDRRPRSPRFTDDPRPTPQRYAEAASRYGVVGHSQTSARARRQRQAPHHPPRLQHRRRRPRGTALRLGAAHRSPTSSPPATR